MKLKPTSLRLRHLPARLATGAYILNSGVTKLEIDPETAATFQAEAAKVVPAVAKLSPEKFGKLLAGTEIALGSALLAPFVPASLAGAGLAAFSGGLVTMYVRTPQLRLPGSLRPSPAGVPLAKDFWMLGIALSLMIDACGDRRRRKNS